MGNNGDMFLGMCFLMLFDCEVCERIYWSLKTWVSGEHQGWQWANGTPRIARDFTYFTSYSNFPGVSHTYSSTSFYRYHDLLIYGKDRCALNCCLQRTNQSPSVDFQSHQNSWIFHRSHPPLRPPSTSRASVRSKGKAALAMVALGVQPLSLLLTNVGPFGDDSPNLPMIPGFGHDVRSLM